MSRPAKSKTKTIDLRPLPLPTAGIMRNFHPFNWADNDLNAGAGIGAGINVGVTATIGVSDQNAGFRLRLLYHIGQVVTVVLLESAGPTPPDRMCPCAAQPQQPCGRLL